MLLKTILNRVQKFKSFVYHEVRWGDPGQDSLEVQVEPVREAVRTVRGVFVRDRDTIGSMCGASSLCRSGTSRSSWCIRRVGSIVVLAGSGWKRCRGRFPSPPKVP